MRVCVLMHNRLLCCYCFCRAGYVDPWDRGSHQSPDYDTRMYAAVLPATQLIRALNTMEKPSVSRPSPPGIARRYQALKSSGGNLRRGQETRVDIRKLETEEKSDGEVDGGRLSRTLSYTEVPSEHVIPEVEARLRSEE